MTVVLGLPPMRYTQPRTATSTVARAGPAPPSASDALARLAYRLRWADRRARLEAACPPRKVLARMMAQNRAVMG